MKKKNHGPFRSTSHVKGGGCFRHQDKCGAKLVNRIALINDLHVMLSPWVYQSPQTKAISGKKDIERGKKGPKASHNDKREVLTEK